MRTGIGRVAAGAASVVVAAAVGVAVALGVAPVADTHAEEGVETVAQAAPAQPAQPARSARASGLPWASGVFSHDAARSVGFAEARGRDVDVLAVFPTRDSWASLSETWWMSPSAVPAGFEGTLAVGLPLFAGDGSMGAAARGEYDQQWRQMGELIASRYPDAYVRIGWEFNIGNWPWAVTPDTVDLYVEAFRRASLALREGAPGLRVVWNPNEGRGDSLPDAALAYPGDAYVDVVGLDAYDWYPVYSAGGWEEHRTKDQGWDYWADFARAHGKTFAVPEWGVMAGSPAAGGDNPEFVRQVVGWMAANADVMEFETYFEETEEYCRCALSQNPLAQAAYTEALTSLVGGEGLGAGRPASALGQACVS